MDKLELLSKKMDRIHDLMETSGLSIEEMLARFAASSYVDCDKCTIKHKCNVIPSADCEHIWLSHLRGE